MTAKKKTIRMKTSAEEAKVKRPTKAEKQDAIIYGIILGTQRNTWRNALSVLFACRQGVTTHISKLDYNTEEERKSMALGAAMLLSAFDVATVKQRLGDQ